MTDSNADGRHGGPLNPQALSLEDVARILTASGWKPVSVDMVRDDIDDGACVVSSRLHPALLAVASGVRLLAVSANPKVTETFASMGRGECVIDPAGVRADQLAAAVLESEAVPATWEVEEASRSVDAVLAEVLS